MGLDNIVNILNEYLIYIQIGFYVILLLPVLIAAIVGLIRGFKRSLWVFLVRLAIYLVFILTLNSVVKLLYEMNFFGLPSLLYSTITNSSNTDILTFKDLGAALIPYFTQGIQLGEISLDSVYISALVDGIIQFAFKIVWAILYFLIIVPIFRIIMGIFYKLFVRGKAAYRRVNKDPFLGLLMGSMNGLISLCVSMVLFGGLMSLISYTGIISVDGPDGLSSTSQTAIPSGDPSTTTGLDQEAQSEKEYLNLQINGENYVIYLAEDEGEGTANSNQLGDLLKTASSICSALKTLSNSWTDNFVVKAANGVTFKYDTGRKDEGEAIYIQKSFLENAFDELIYIDYYIPKNEDEADSEDLQIKINLFDDLNNILNAALYIIDDEDLYTTNNGLTEFSLDKLKSARIEIAFDKLSDLSLFKTALSVGIGIAVKSYGDNLGITEADQNRLAKIDWSEDLSKMGKFIGGFVDAGLGSLINDVMTNKISLNNENMDPLINAVMKILNPPKKANETSQDYHNRKKNIRDKITDSISGLNLIKEGSKLIASYLVDNTMKDTVLSMGLDDNNLNRLKDSNGDYIDTGSYIDALVDHISLSEDMGVIFNILFDIGDWNSGDSGEENYFSYFLENYQNIASLLIEDNPDKPAGLNMNKVSELMNSLLGNIAELSFVQSMFDIAIKVVTSSLNNPKEGEESSEYMQYLTEENLFYNYIDWESELGTKIPNLVTALLEADVIGLVMPSEGEDDDIATKLFEKESLKDYLSDTLEALFNLQLLSNLEDTALRPLFTSLVSSLASGAFTIVISDSLGTAGHRFKDELLNMLSIVDDLLSGAKSRGASSFSELFDTANLNYLIGGIAEVDVSNLENSLVLGPTLVYFLANNASSLTGDTLSLVIPYIYEDPLWYTDYELDINGEYVLDENEDRIVILEADGGHGYGELHRLLVALQSVSTNEAITDLLTGQSSGDTSGSDDPDGGSDETDDMFKILEDIDSDIIKTLFSSLTIRATITSLLADFTDFGESFSIIIPAAAKDPTGVKISNYELDDTEVVVLSGDENKIVHKLSDDESVDVYYGTKKYILSSEFESVVLAINQVDLKALSDADQSLMMDEIQNLDGHAIKSRKLVTNNPDNLDNNVYFDPETKLEKKTKIDVLFESNILRYTISNFLTSNETVSDLFVYPLDEMELVDEKYYIKLSGLKGLFNSIFEIVGSIESFDDIGIDLISDLLELDDASLSKLFASGILRATISVKVSGIDALILPVALDKSQGGENQVILEEVDVVSGSSMTESTKYVLKEDELKSLIKALALVFTDGISDFESIDYTSLISDFLELTDSELDTLFASGILRATITDNVIGIDAIITPYLFEKGTGTSDDVYTCFYSQVLTEITDANNNVTQDITSHKYVLYVNELKNLMKALGIAFKDGFDDFADIDYVALISDFLNLTDTELDDLFSSNILRATITDTVIGMDAIITPYLIENDLSSTSDDVYTAELSNVIKRVEEGGVTSDNTSSSRYVLTINELKALMKGLGIAFKDGFDDFADIDYVALISDFLNLTDTELTTLFSSNILRATITDKVIDMDAIITPYLIENEPNDVYTAELSSVIKRVENAGVITDNTSSSRYILTINELKALIKALGIAFKDGFDDFATIDYVALISDFLNLTDTELTTLFSSNILRATITDKVIGMDAIITPYLIENDPDDVYTAVLSSVIKRVENAGVISDNTSSSRYILTINELKALIKALGIAFADGFDDFADIDYVALISDFLNLTDAELTTLFSSNILRATITDKVIGMEAIITPYLIENDPDDNTDDEYTSILASVIKQTTVGSEVIDDISSSRYVLKVDELKNLIKALGIAFADGFDDFATIDYVALISDFLNLSDAELTTLFSSNILRATITDKVIGMDAIITPYLIENNPDDNTDDEYTSILASVIKQITLGSEVTDDISSSRYVLKVNELKNLIKALGIAFADGFDDFATIDYVALISDFLNLSDAELTTLFSSNILRATITDKVIGMDAIITPYLIENNPDDVSDDEYTSILASVIKQITLGSEVTDDISSSRYVLKVDELKNLIKALGTIFKNGLQDFAAIDYTALISDFLNMSDNELDTLFSSNILRATISKQLTESGSITIPKVFYGESGPEDDVYITDYPSIITQTLSSGVVVSESVTEHRYVIFKDECKNMIKSMSVLFTDTVDINDISTDILSDLLELSDSSIDRLFTSGILRATISSKLLEISNIRVPVKTLSTTTVEDADIVEYSAGVYSTAGFLCITDTELSNMIKGLRVVFNGEVDFNAIGIDNFKNLSTALENDLNDLASSAILRATISNLLSDSFASGSSTSIIIPSIVSEGYLLYEDGVNTTNAFNDKMVTADEMKALLRAMGYFDFDTLGDSSQAFDTVKLLTKSSNISGKTQIQVILESKIMQATLSSIILSMSSSTMSLIIPKSVMDLAQVLDIDNAPINVISSAELINMISALNYIDANAFTDGTEIFNTIKTLTNYLHLHTYKRIVDKILESDILLATFSSYILELNGLAIDISIPRNSTALQSSGDADLHDTYLYTNMSAKDGANNTTYLLTKSELIKFILAASSIDLSTFSSNQTGAIKGLSAISKIDPTRTNIQMIVDSEILRLSISSYLITNLANFGFSQIIFPSTVIDSVTAVDYDSVNNTYGSKTVYEINGIRFAGTANESYELERLIVGITYLNLENMAIDTMGAISSLSETISGTAVTKLDRVISSDILRFTLSNQITDISSLTIPDQAYERTLAGFNYLKTPYYIFSGGSLNTVSINLLTTEELNDLISSISSGVIDLENLNANEILTLDKAAVTLLLGSKIIYGTMADKMAILLKNNDNIHEYYNGYMEDDNYYYTDDLSVVHKLISKEEIINLFVSLNVIGQNDYENFDISIENLDSLTSDGDTTNDDDPDFDFDDQRAQLLRSILIRTILTGKTSILTSGANNEDYERRASGGETKDYLKVGYITTTVSLAYNATFTDPATKELTLVDKILSFSPVTAMLGDGGATTYHIYVNGTEVQSTTATSGIDLSGVLGADGQYKIRVVAKNTSILFVPPFYHNYNPYYYDMYTETIYSTLPTIETAEVSDNKIIFEAFLRVDQYIIRFYELDQDVLVDSPIKTIYINKNINDGEEIETDLTDLFAPGSYKFTIQTHANEPYYSDSVPYTDNNYRYSLSFALDSPDVELIYDELSGKYRIYFKTVDQASSYKLTLNGIEYTEFENFAVMNTETAQLEYTSKYLELTGAILNTIPYGQYDVVVSTNMGGVFTEGSTSLTINILEPVEAITKVVETAGTNKVIKVVFGDLEGDGSISAIENANKYMVWIYRLIDANDSVGELCLYKEVSNNFIDVSGLKSGYAYRVVIQAFSTDNPYISVQYDSSTSLSDDLEVIYLVKTLKAPARHSVNIDEDEILLTFEAVENAADYSLVIYSVTTVESVETDTIVLSETSDFAYTVEDNIVSIDISSLMTYVDGTIYRVKAKALHGSSKVYADSELSIGKKFTYSLPQA